MPRGRLEEVQILRAVAATAVAWHHTLEIAKGVGHRGVAPDWLILLGAAGVDVFFVISGFIMVYISARQTGQKQMATRFMLSRLRRIYPIYWVCCVAILLSLALGYFSSKDLTLEEIALSLVLWPTENRIIGISWTLSFEMIFYTLFAIGLLARRVDLAVLFSSAAIVVLIPASLIAMGPDAFMANPIMLEFVFGMAVGMAYVRGHLRAAWLGSLPVLLLAIGLFCLSAMAFVIPDDTNEMSRSVRFLAWGVPSVVVVLWALNATTGALPFRRTLVELGDASYSVYLFHTLVLVFYVKAYVKILAVIELPLWVFSALGVLLSVVSGIAIHRLVERPLGHWLTPRAHQRPIRQSAS